MMKCQCNFRAATVLYVAKSPVAEHIHQFGRIGNHDAGSSVTQDAAAAIIDCRLNAEVGG
jgi:hypothetical protein